MWALSNLIVEIVIAVKKLLQNTDRFIEQSLILYSSESEYKEKFTSDFRYKISYKKHTHKAKWRRWYCWELELEIRKSWMNVKRSMSHHWSVVDMSWGNPTMFSSKRGELRWLLRWKYWNKKLEKCTFIHNVLRGLRGL